MISASQILNASILVVDDQEANVTLLGRMLLGAGYTSVSSTRNPLEVCELQRHHRYSLILLDLQMPGMDGFQVLDALKEIEKDDYVPVLVITAQPGHKLRALQDGAKGFISKPFDLAEMLIRVKRETDSTDSGSGGPIPIEVRILPGALLTRRSGAVATCPPKRRSREGGRRSGGARASWQ